MLRENLLLSLFVFFMISVTYGQEDAIEPEKRLKPSEGDWGFTFNLTGLITNLELSANEDLIGNQILFFRHYLKDDLAIRAGFGLTTNRQKSVRKDSLRQIPAFVEFDSLFSRSDVAISFGVEKHLDHLRRLDPYFGGELLFQIIGKENVSYNRNETTTAGTTSLEGERKVDGGFGIGLYGIAGFNYFITERISLGAEYRFGYNFLKTGGNFSESEITTPPSGSVTSVFNKGTAEERISGFAVNSTANIIFSIFF